VSIITAKQLHQETKSVLNQLEQGQTLLITRNGRTIGRIEPLAAAEQAGWLTSWPKSGARKKCQIQRSCSQPGVAGTATPAAMKIYADTSALIAWFHPADEFARVVTDGAGNDPQSSGSSFG